MIKKVIDMRYELEEVLKDKELLDVYFLAEENSFGGYHLLTIVAKTDKMLYVSPRGSYAFESTHGGELALLNVLTAIFKKNPNFNSFHIWCAKNQDLEILEDETYLECNKLPKIDCNIFVSGIKYDTFARERLKELKEIVFRKLRFEKEFDERIYQNIKGKIWL